MLYVASYGSLIILIMFMVSGRAVSHRDSDSAHPTPHSKSLLGSPLSCLIYMDSLEPTGHAGLGWPYHSLFL